MNTGEKIKYARSLCGLTQKELSKQSGISEVTIRKYESNERTPTKEKLLKLAQVMDIHVNDLLDDALLKQDYSESDVCSVLRSIDKSIGIKLHYDFDNPTPESVRIEICDEEINDTLLEWARLRDEYYTKVLSMNDKSKAVDWINLDCMQRQLELFEQRMVIPFKPQSYRYDIKPGVKSQSET